jgi:MoaA/NifB/PqqE/SkfB family radical SAM enzyme
MKIVSGHRLRLVRALMILQVAGIALRRFPQPARVWRALRSLADLLTNMSGGRTVAKCAQAGGRYFTHLYGPGWPSRAFRDHLTAELELAVAAGDDQMRSSRAPATPGARLQTVIFAVTKSCQLRCQHCCEWEALNQPEALSAADIASVVSRFQTLGVVQIHFSGGEPLLRIDDVIEAVRQAKPGTDFWIFTSGVGLTRECATRLRNAGIVGVNLSLDHWRPAGHDAFRGMAGTFAWVERAAASVRGADLALCLTLCPAREFVSRDNLFRYAELATGLGAGFIQILEPRSVGRYAGRQISLGVEERAILERFCLEMNHDPAHAHRPVVIYPGWDQRRIGCLGAGWRYVYVDTDARLHPCPFCRRAGESALAGDLGSAILALRGRGCPAPADAGLAGGQELVATQDTRASRRETQGSGSGRG